MNYPREVGRERKILGLLNNKKPNINLKYQGIQSMELNQNLDLLTLDLHIHALSP
jgi:hypothetical protein